MPPLLTGKTFSHYRVLEKLGEGGVGVVYKAEDLSLKRTVALKFLNPHLFASTDEKTRFVHEAQAASSIDHPNICTIYAIEQTAEDQLFIVMACYEGETLQQRIKKGPLGIEEAVDLAAQISDGVRAAHGKGIVHRDIKSSNIILTADGQVKILDFGLARTTGAMLLTKAGETLGTVPYMSPEQAKGEPVDHRTDLWSIGVVLYEMLSGRLPFQSVYSEAVVYSILNEEPPSLDSLRPGLPPTLRRVVERALLKNPDERYQDAAGLLNDLRGLKDGGASVLPPAPRTRKRRAGVALVLTIIALALLGGIFLLYRDRGVSPSGPTTADAGKEVNSIAVLPFKNISADPEQEYFCDGMTEELITLLSNIHSLKVIARTSVMQFKNTDRDIPSIGKQLGVSNILEGSIRKSGNTVRITAQLIKASDGFHLWANQYDRELKDIFVLQDDVSKAIAEALRINLTNEQRAALKKHYTDNTEAYQLYLQGRFHWNARTADRIKKGIRFFEQATNVDPGYALAYAGLADSYVLPALLVTPTEAVPKGKAAAMKALGIDEEMAEPHAALAYAMTWFDYDWMGAEREFKRSIEIDPGNPIAHHWYGFYLSALGRFEEAIAEEKLALRFDPLSPIINATLAWAYYLSRQYDDAIDQCRKTLDLYPTFYVAFWVLGWSYDQKGMYQEAVATFQKGLEGGGSVAMKGAIGYTYAIEGKNDEAERVISELSAMSDREYMQTYPLAQIFSGLGDNDRAFHELQAAYEQRNPLLYLAKVDPWLDKIRSDHRFAELIDRMGLH